MTHDSSIPTGIQFSFTDVTFEITDLNLDLKGGKSWFYGFFKSFMENMIKDELYTALYGFKVKGPQLIEENLMKIIDLPLPWMNLSLVVEDINFSNGLMEMSNAGIFHYKNIVYPGKPSPLPPIPSSAEMIDFLISDYCLESGLYLASRLNLVHYVLTEAKIPPKARPWINLNTSFFGMILPELQKLYPNKAMQISISLDQKTEPTISFSQASQIDVSADFNIVFQVILPKKKSENDDDIVDAFSVATLFGINMTVVALTSSTSDISLTVHLGTDVNKFEMTLLQSAIGQINVKALQNFLALLMPEALKLVDSYLADHPFVIQQSMIPYVAVTNPQVVFGEGYLWVKTNFTLKF